LNPSDPALLNWFVAQDGNVLVGHEALSASASAPDSTFYSIKRLLGRTVSEVQRTLKGLTYMVGSTGLHHRMGKKACALSLIALQDKCC
jgi:molecular chaperone DnaK (HSP70)